MPWCTCRSVVNLLHNCTCSARAVPYDIPGRGTRITTSLRGKSWNPPIKAEWTTHQWTRLDFVLDCTSDLLEMRDRGHMSQGLDMWLSTTILVGILCYFTTNRTDNVKFFGWSDVNIFTYIGRIEVHTDIYKNRDSLEPYRSAPGMPRRTHTLCVSTVIPPLNLNNTHHIAVMYH